MTTIVLDSPERVAYAQKQIGRLPVADRAFACTIEPHREKRSLKANARLWALHAKAAEHVGCGAQEMHEEMLCEHYGASVIEMPNGAIRRVPLKRSSLRNTKEFAAFMEFCEAFYIAQLGVFLGDD